MGRPVSAIDQTRSDMLAAEIGESLKRHYASRGQPTPACVFEALNALAFMSAAVIAGCEGELLDEFLSELSRQLEKLRATAKKETMQ